MGVQGKDGRFKARLVAQGFSQQSGTDYDQTFCPVVWQELFRTLLAIAVEQAMELHYVDKTTAFLNGNLDEEVYQSGTVKRARRTWYVVCPKVSMDSSKLQDVGIPPSTSHTFKNPTLP